MVVGAEGDPGEQCLGGAEHGRVGAPVDPQAGEAGAGGVGGLDVGVNVGAPEGVDGLFGIADQHERGGRDVVALSGIAGSGERRGRRRCRRWPIGPGSVSWNSSMRAIR